MKICGIDPGLSGGIAFIAGWFMLIYNILISRY